MEVGTNVIYELQMLQLTFMYLNDTFWVYIREYLEGFYVQYTHVQIYTI